MLEIKNLRFGYSQGQQIFSGTSAIAKTGGIIGVIGLNGAGKTTLFDLIMGFRQPKSGSIELLEIKSKTLLVQYATLIDLLTLKDNIRLVSYLKGIKLLDKIAEQLSINNRQHLLDCKYGSLSGGEKRWLCVQIILQLNTELVLLDEPTTGLDPTARANIWQSISNRKNGLIFISSHHLHELAAYTNDVWLIHNGQIVCFSSFSQFCTTYGTDNLDQAFAQATA